MRIVLRSLALCILTALSTAGSLGARLEQSTGEITGRILSSQGVGLGGATIRIQEGRGNKLVATASSAADGRFIISDAPVGCRYIVYVDAPGCGREFIEDVYVFPAQATDVGEIRACPGVVCRGRVVREGGAPAAGVKVTVTAWRHELAHTIALFGPIWQVKTDDEGRYATPPVPVSYVTFSAAPAGGFVESRGARIYATPDSPEVTVNDIQLVPEVPLEGIVVDGKGKPIPRAQVSHTANHDLTARTDAEGRFTIGGCSAKTIENARVFVEAAGFASYAETDAKHDRPRKITLMPCSYISGRAVDVETGQPVEIKKVVVCDVKRDAAGKPQSYGCGEARFEQKRKGEFRISVSTKGEKHLTVVADGYHYCEEYVLGFDFARGITGVTLKMRRSGGSTSAAAQRIRGVVRSGGKGAGEVWVSLWQKKPEWDKVNSWMSRGRTVDGTYRPCEIDVLSDSSGGYLLDVANPGEYFVVARPHRGAPAISRPVTVTADEELICDLELLAGATIHGEVAGIAPQRAKQLWVIAFGRTPFRKAVPIDPTGHFSLGDVPPGEIGLKVGHEGYVDADVARYPWHEEAWNDVSEPWTRAVTIEARPGETVDNVHLEYPPPGQADGEPQ